MIDRLKHRIAAAPAQAGFALVALLAALSLGGAWYLQLVGGLFPCPLCLEQRWPWYIGGVVAVALLVLGERVRSWNIWALPVLALTMAWGAWRALYHVGVEHHWWGSSCTGGGNVGPISIEDLENLTQGTVGVPCDAIQWDFLGITLAGFNLAISLAVVAVLAYLFWRARSLARAE